MISSDKKRVALSINQSQLTALKHKAIDAGMTLSDYLVEAGSVTDPTKLKRNIAINNGGVPPAGW